MSCSAARMGSVTGYVFGNGIGSVTGCVFGIGIESVAGCVFGGDGWAYDIGFGGLDEAAE